MAEKLKEYCTVISGYAFKSKDLSEGTDIPVIKIGNISNGKNVVIDDSTQYVNEEFLSVDEKYHIKNGDILISLTGSHMNQPNSMVGRCCRNLDDTIYLLNQRAGKIIPNKSVDKDFLYYVFRLPSIQYAIANRAYGGANQVNVSPKDVMGIKFDIPDITIQKKIADVLNAYDSLIQNNNKRIHLLEQMAENLYKEWFVRFRFPGYENTKFVDGIPSDWQMLRMRDFCHVTDGTHDTPKPVSDGGVPLVTGKCIKNGFIDFNEPYNISYQDHESISKRSGLQKGDILFSNIGTVGTTCLVNYDREFSVKNVIIFKPGNITVSNYLYSWLNSDSIQAIFATQTNGASQQFVGLNFMRRFKILVPNANVLELYSDRIKTIRTEIVKLHDINENLTKQRDMLLPRLMSGKLKV